MNASASLERTQYYLDLRYPVTIRELTPEEGGGYMATIPQLGSSTFVADGETAVEALEALEALRRHLIPKLLEDGEELPEPADEKEPIEQYSGNLVLRIPKRLHARLASEAKRSACSINKLATELLSQSLERSVLLREMHRLLEEKGPQTAPLNSSSPKGTTQAARPKGLGVPEVSLPGDRA